MVTDKTKLIHEINKARSDKGGPSYLLLSDSKTHPSVLDNTQLSPFISFIHIFLSISTSILTLGQVDTEPNRQAPSSSTVIQEAVHDLFRWAYSLIHQTNIHTHSYHDTQDTRELKTTPDRSNNSEPWPVAEQLTNTSKQWTQHRN